MSAALASLIARGVTGVYRWRGRTKPAAAAKAAAAAGWRAFHLSLGGARTKAALLEAAAESLALPSYFGHNWDALEECLGDMSWAPAKGYLLLIDSPARLASASPGAWATMVTILRDTAERWQERGTPMLVLVRGAGKAAPFEEAPGG